jgi:hypothetical protein
VTNFKRTASGKFLAGNCVEIWQDDGIIHVLYLDHAEITIEIKKEMHEIYLHVTEGKKMPFLFGSMGSLWFTRDARDFAVEIEPKQPFLAVAMFAPTLGYRLIAEFYGKFSKPLTPYRVFKDMDEAMSWLKSFGGEGTGGV